MFTDTNQKPPETLVSKRILSIENSHPTSVYINALNLINNRGPSDIVRIWNGDSIGEVKTEDPNNPIKMIESRVTGIKTFEKYEDIPDKPGCKQGVGERIPEFGLYSEFTLQNGTYISSEIARSLTDTIADSGYKVNIFTDIRNGMNNINISNSLGDFELRIGYTDKENELNQLRVNLENAKKSKGPISVYQEEMTKVENGENKSVVKLQVKPDHPDHIPEGRKLESEDQVLSHLSGLQDLTEIIATALTDKLGNGKSFPKLNMKWESHSAPFAIWHDVNKVQNNEDLNNLSILDINSSLVRIVQGLNDKNDCPDLIDEKGINKEANKLLEIIESHFDNQKIGTSEITSLGERDRSLLALGLALKIVQQTKVTGTNLSLPDQAELAGITFHLEGESRRNKLEFFMQQDSKFNYNKEDSEASDFFLLHTTSYDQTDKLTKYERIQSSNLENTRNWIIKNLESSKKGNYDPSDVLQINNLLLTGLVPDRFLGKFRHTKSGYIPGRFGITEAGDVERNLKYLLEAADKYVSEKNDLSISPDQNESLRTLARFWASFDGIHPFEEGNGRTGTMLFESWLRLKLGSEKKFVSERTETQDLSNAISEALKGNSQKEFWFLNQEEFIKDENLTPLVDYIKAHIT
jgi:fido (protein-threonine AMPylation protein)